MTECQKCEDAIAQSGWHRERAIASNYLLAIFGKHCDWIHSIGQKDKAMEPRKLQVHITDNSAVKY